jgi:hypothetical protein
LEFIMKSIAFMLVVFFYSFSSNAFDKYDAMVCEANSDDSARIQCYRNTNISNECKNKKKIDELICYRDITKKIENNENDSKEVKNQTNR